LIDFLSIFSGESSAKKLSIINFLHLPKQQQMADYDHNRHEHLSLFPLMLVSLLVLLLK